jgi:HAD superfamily hydrolase (TIGR01549 family)
MKTKAIIFDLYNTLLYTKHKTKPYLNLFRSLGLSKEEMNFWRDKVMTENFNSFEDLKNTINPSSNVYVEKYEYDVQEENDSTHLFDDTKFVLDELFKRYDLYLISNIATPYKKCFYNLGLDKWFREPIFSCDVGCSKPDPKIYDIVIQKSGLQPGQLLMIGDSVKADFEGSMNCGIKAILKDKPLKLILPNLV